MQVIINKRFLDFEGLLSFYKEKKSKLYDSHSPDH